MELLSDRLRLVAADVALATAQMGPPQELAQALDAEIPSEWPPDHYDAPVARWMHSKLAENPDQKGWWSWYVLLARADSPDVVVGIIGFKGPPRQGVVEVGYSVVASYHRQRIATESVARLIEWAFGHEEIRRVEAETLPDGAASIGVLTKLGFQAVDSSNSDVIRFALDR